MTFSNIKQVSAGDTSTVMIRLGTFNTDTTDNFVIYNVTAEQSTIPLFEMGSLQETSNSSRSFRMSSIKYVDSMFEFSQDLIVFGNVETDSDFEITIDDVTMYNLTFSRFGSLIKFRQQTIKPLKMSNCMFNNIYGSSINLESANIKNADIKTSVEITNMTVYEISGGTNSFIVNREGGDLTVTDSTFTHIDNIENGAVINGNFQNSKSTFHNCTFAKNTAYYGGVANVQDGSVIKFYESTFTNNFAIQAGVIQVASEGYFEMYDCDIQDNYALSLPVAEIFIASQASIINNSTFKNNIAYTKEYILNELVN